MHRIIAAALAAIVSLSIAATPLSAHVGGEALLVVTIDHVMPGEPFAIIGADLGANATVAFRMQRDDMVVPLDSAVAGPDGHFTTALVLPADFPNGYAELIAASDDGSQASTWVLVGPRTSATPLAPDQAEWWADPSVLVLIGIIVAGVGALTWLVLRPRQPAPKAAAATAGRRSSSGKRARRASGRRD